jgi:hypothetical protein
MPGGSMIIRVGEWAVADRLLRTGSARVHRVIDQAVQQEAQFLRSKIVEGLRTQAPGGQAFTPLAPATLAKRNLRGFHGTKALLVRGDLRNGFVVRRSGWGASFVGVLRTARGRDGQPLANVAELNEFGSRPIVIHITPQMAAFLGALARASGHDAGAGSSGGGGSRTGIVVVQIPPRPFIRPVVERYFGNQNEVRDRFFGRIAVLLRGDFGGRGGGGPLSTFSPTRQGGGVSGGVTSGIAGLFTRRGPPGRDARTGRFISRR